MGKNSTTTNLQPRSNCEERLTTPSHLHQITQIARKQTRGSSVDWQDAMQAAQIKLLRGIRAGKFRTGTIADFDRWAATVAKYEIIDLVRRSKCQVWESIDRQIADNINLLDTIADSVDLLESLATRELVCRVRAALVTLDRRYPDRGYARLWCGKVREISQTELARELGITQGAISKRWRELLSRLAVELDLVPPATVVGVGDSLPLGADCAQHNRIRSHQVW